MLNTTEMGIFQLQLYNGCMDRHGAKDVSPNLCRKQKQTDAGQYDPNNEKKRVTHGAAVTGRRQ